jgi:hypothetical protein
MNIQSKCLSLKLRTSVLFSALWLVSCCLAQDERQSQPLDGSNAKRLLLDYLRSRNVDVDSTSRYSVRSVSLSGESAPEIVVYLSGPGWCGSGGCSMVILKPQDNAYRVVAEFTLVRLPLCVLRTRTNGWRDLSFRVQGGGVVHGYSVVISFDGTQYPNNPSPIPIHRSSDECEGDIIFPLSTEGELIYR